YRSVERKPLHVNFDLLKGFVKDTPFGFGRLLILYRPVSIVKEKPPSFFKETGYAFNAFGIPGFGHFNRAQEHLIESECIGPISRNDVIGVDDIVSAFAHFLHLWLTEE